MSMNTPTPRKEDVYRRHRAGVATRLVRIEELVEDVAAKVEKTEALLRKQLARDANYGE
jgi:hypothetical protein